MIHWLTSKKGDNPSAPGELLQQMLDAPGILRMPGAHNAIAALLAQKAGFRALYISGAAVSATAGLADLGILSMDELCTAVRCVTRATGLPVLVDGDTGYGEAINVVRLVRELEACGAAAVQIEDQEFPKKCGHLSDKKLIPAARMAEKIAAARSARSHLRIVARTDAAAVDGVTEAVRRARIYIEAGADVIFPEALTSRDEFITAARAIEAPLLANMTEFGRTPCLSADEFERLGYKIVIWPVSALRIAARAMETFYADLAATGTTEAHIGRMQTRRELYDLIRYEEYEQLDRNILKSGIP